MWEMIQANRRKSLVLIVLLATVLMLLGYAMGYLLDPRAGPPMGVVVAMAVWIVLMLTALGGGERVLLASAGAREVTPDQAPQLFHIVEEMKIASGLPSMPRVFVIESRSPNAFAVGLKPERAAVAVTTGLLAHLNRDELQGVIGHEIGHIQNRDTLFMTLAGVTVGSVILLADLFLRGLWYAGGRRRGRRDSAGGAAVLLVALVLAVLAPLLAQLLYFACSRRREYLADASSAVYTRYPEGLASALEKIAAAAERIPLETSRALAPMYIVNPLAAESRGSGLFSTHPPTEERIRILRSMAGDVSFAAYEEAFRRTQRASLLGAATLKASAPLPPRPARPEAPPDPRRGWREAQDLLHRADRYALLACGCGLRLKVPPEFAGRRVSCPRCGTVHAIPPELFAAVAALRKVDTPGAAPGTA